MVDLGDIRREEVRAISTILRRLDVLGGLSGDMEQGRLLRFALTDAFSAGARAASAAVLGERAPDSRQRDDAEVGRTMLHANRSSLLQEEIDRRKAD